jgi:AbrB family looped-hinge helix DNA binding protein
MPTATLTNDGTITIPASIRRRFGYESGLRFNVFSQPDGAITLMPPKRTKTNADVFRAFREAMRGEAERVGWKDERDVVAYIKELRREKAASNAGNV